MRHIAAYAQRRRRSTVALAGACAPFSGTGHGIPPPRDDQRVDLHLLREVLVQPAEIAADESEVVPATPNHRVTEPPDAISDECCRAWVLLVLDHPRLPVHEVRAVQAEVNLGVVS
jgi:hypothetical protein